VEAQSIIRRRYRLEKKIGSGAFYETWLATDLFQSQPVTLKLFTSSNTYDEEQSELLIKELLTHSKLYHPNLSRLLDFGSLIRSTNNPTELYLVTEYLQGSNLDALPALLPIKNHVKEYLDLFLQSLRVLAFLHHHRLIHGNINSSNILVTTNSEKKYLLKMVDAGVISRIANQHLDVQSDIFSLGITFIKLLSGSNQLSNLTTPAGFPTKFKDVLKRMAAPQLHQRYSSVLAVLGDLNRLCGLNLPLDTVPEQTMRIYQPRLVGQEPLQEAIQKTIQQTQDNTTSELPQFMILTGESGIGKTTILEATKSWARLKGWQVFNFQAHAVAETLQQLIRWTCPEATFADQNQKETNGQNFMIAEHFFSAINRNQTSDSFLFLCDNFEEFDTYEQQLIFDLLSHQNNKRKSHNSLNLAYFLISLNQQSKTLLSHLQEIALQSANNQLPMTLSVPSLSRDPSKILLEEILGSQQIHAAVEDFLIDLAGGNPSMLQHIVQNLAAKGLLRHLEKKSAIEKIKLLFNLGTDQNSDLFFNQKLSQLSSSDLIWCTGISLINFPISIEIATLIRWQGESTATIQERISNLQQSGLLTIENNQIKLRFSQFKQKLVAISTQHDIDILELRKQLVAKLIELKNQPDHPFVDHLLNQELWFQMLAIDPKQVDLRAGIALAEKLTLEGCSLQAQNIYEQAAQEAESRSITLISNSEEIDVTIQLSEKLIDFGKLSQADKLLNNLDASFAESRQQSDLHMRFLKQLGRLRRYQGNFKEALRIASRGIEISQQFQRPDELVHFLGLQAISFLLLGDFDRALKSVDEGILIHTQQPEEHIQLLLLKGHSLKAKRQFNDSLQIYRQVVEQSQQIHFHAGIANGEQSLGLIAQSQGNLDQAAKHFKSAAETFDKNGQRLGSLSCQFTCSLFNNFSVVFS
jgi:serine/threonine protein kinase